MDSFNRKLASLLSLAEVNSDWIRDPIFLELCNELQLDSLNLEYFVRLYQKWLNKTEIKEVGLFSSKIDGPFSIVPSALANSDYLKKFPVSSYIKICNEVDPEAASRAVVWIKKMHAGLGTSLERKSYLYQQTGKVELGAKGTDLFKELPTIDENGKTNSVLCSLAELQILQAVSAASTGVYKRVVWHDVVSADTKKSVASIWKKRWVRPHKELSLQSYDHHFRHQERLDHFGVTEQGIIPTISSSNQLTFLRKAPGGHGLFGFEAILACLDDTKRPFVSDDEFLIGLIGNGEDLSSSPDKYIVSWMVENHVPIAMITTTKSPIDLKGGQIAYAQDEKGHDYFQIVELVQAQTSGQQELFKAMGLREGDNDSYFNTNMVLINYNILVPLIKGAVHKFGRNKFLEKIIPDLILNSKKQSNNNGEVETFIQLEGAMGSVILNLDRFWRREYGVGLVQFLNVETQMRTRFFSPVKTAFDFILQFHSDRFSLDLSEMRLVDRNGGRLPIIDLKDELYQDLAQTLLRFKECSLIELTHLHVEGLFNFSQVKLKGHIEAINHSGKDFELFKNGIGELSSCKFLVESDGSFKQVKLPNV